MSGKITAVFFAVTIVFSSVAVCEVSKPNIVFFFIDDLGWADLGCYGSRYHQTPNIDALARSGMRFTDGYAACPVCSPTRAALMTGKFPARLGITDWIGATQKRNALLTPVNVSALPQAELTFAEVLREAGYATAYFGKWHLGAKDGDHPSTQGFDYHRGVNRAGAPGSYHYPFRRNRNTGNKPASHDVPDFTDARQGSYLTDLLAGEAVKFVEKSKDKPFLLLLAHYSVHTPIQARQQDIAQYSARRDKLGLPVKVGMRPEKYGQTRITQNNPAFAGMVASVDRSVGRVLGKVRELGLEGDTLVIFTSDNGGLSTLPGKRSAPTSCLPLRAGKGWLYEGGVRVPTIISWPGVTKPGSVSSVPVVTTDFYPTLLSAAGLPLRPAQHLDGVDLTPLMKGGDLERKALYWHYPHYHGSANRPSASVRKGDYKLLRWYEDGSEELFNLADDLAESKDLALQQKGKRRELADDLDRWLKATGAKMAVPVAGN
jgi:arylsulfatase A-like enzyme